MNYLVWLLQIDYYLHVCIARPGLEVSDKQIKDMIDTYDPTIFFNDVRSAVQKCMYFSE